MTAFIILAFACLACVCLVVLGFIGVNVRLTALENAVDELRRLT
jgi:hypothetical protein